MNLEERNQDNKALLGFKGSMDLFMGAIYVAVSVFVWKFPSAMDQFGKVPVGAFSILFGLYGVFRIYRGWSSIRVMMNKRKQ
ncbi:MAG: hypothetical protein JNM95_14550 [Chitinophagaceae bacterium]|nr:hypothetical protein [Chitinophagaceae bacterium]